ncbi:hypothetical protein SNEBB_003582 [Seison nebaliae]|nr:hypothetical protein SNEBB_003582 [Seison nebaliae]
MNENDSDDFLKKYESGMVQPLPSLDHTFKQYIDNITPLLTENELAYSKSCVKDFLKENGYGRKFQKIIEEIHEKKKTSWSLDAWLNEMYFDVDLPVIINSSACTVIPKKLHLSTDDWLSYSAKIILSIIHFRYLLLSGQIPQEKSCTHNATSHYCMNQYRSLFNVHRHPGINRDYHVIKKMENDTLKFMVSYKSQLFIITIPMGDYLKKFKENINTAEEFLNIFNTLKSIVDGNCLNQNIYENLTSDENFCLFNSINILTTNSRREWGAQLLTIRRYVSDNEDNIKHIESAEFLLCLDDCQSCYKDLTEQSMAHQIFHGGGSRQFTSNRYWDTTLQIVSGKSGVSGVIVQHSACEGVVTNRLLEFILKGINNYKDIKLSKTTRYNIRPIIWKLPSTLTRWLSNAENKVDKSINNIDLYINRFHVFGKRSIKLMKTSPDAFIQIAMQLAYYQLHGHFTATYESASLRQFQYGRVDNIRACHPESQQFVLAASKNNLISNLINNMLFGRTNKNITVEYEQLQNLLRSALGKQIEIIKLNVNGMGMDLHLTTLKEMNKKYAENGELDLCEIFRDKAYDVIQNFRLTTSQLTTNDANIFGYYGPVKVDGYGCSYNIQDEEILFVVTTFKECGETDCKLFAWELYKSLIFCSAVLQLTFTK